MCSLFLAGAMLLACLSTVFGVVYYWTQNQFLYHPTSDLHAPNERKACELFKAQDHIFKSKDGTMLHGRLIPANKEDPEQKNSTILFCHGNAGTVLEASQIAVYLSKILARNVFVFDYRGFGKSEGVAYEAGIKLDAEAAFEMAWNLPSTDKSDFIVFGHSLGGGVAFYLGNRYTNKIKAIIIDNSFSSLQEVIPEAIPSFLAFSKYFCYERWESWKEFEQMLQKDWHPEVLLIRGEKDSLIAGKHLKILEQIALKNKKRRVEVLRIPSGYHCMIEKPLYSLPVLSFLENRVDD